MKSLFLDCRPVALCAGLSLFWTLSLLAALPSPAQRSANPNASAFAFAFSSLRSAAQANTASTAVASSHEGTIPVGTILPVVLRTSFSFDKCKPGQVLRGKTDREIPLLRGSTIPKGADIVGHIVEVIPASKVANAKVSMQFDKLYLSGQWISLVTDLAAIGDYPDALWALAPDARGTYGFENLLIAHAGKTSPVGTIVLASQTHNLKLRNGNALLLRVD